MSFTPSRKRTKRENGSAGRDFDDDEALFLNNFANYAVEAIFNEHEGGATLLKFAREEEERNAVMACLKSIDPQMQHTFGKALHQAANAATALEPKIAAMKKTLMEGMEAVMEAENLMAAGKAFLKETRAVQTTGARIPLYEHTVHTIEALCAKIDFRNWPLKKIAKELGITVDTLKEVTKEKKVILITVLRLAHANGDGLPKNSEWNTNMERMISDGVFHTIPTTRILHRACMSIETAQTIIAIYLSLDGCLDERPEGTKFGARYNTEREDRDGSPWTINPNPDGLVPPSPPATPSMQAPAQQYGYSPYHRASPSSFQGLSFGFHAAQGGHSPASTNSQGGGIGPYQHQAQGASACDPSVASVPQGSPAPTFPPGGGWPTFCVGSNTKLPPSARKKSRVRPTNIALSVATTATEPPSNQSPMSDSMQM